MGEAKLGSPAGFWHEETLAKSNEVMRITIVFFKM